MSDLINGDQELPNLATDKSNYLIRKVTRQITAKGKFDSDAHKRQFSINWDWKSNNIPTRGIEDYQKWKSDMSNRHKRQFLPETSKTGNFQFEKEYA